MKPSLIRTSVFAAPVNAQMAPGPIFRLRMWYVPGCM